MANRGADHPALKEGARRWMELGGKEMAVPALGRLTPKISPTVYRPAVYPSSVPAGPRYLTLSGRVFVQVPLLPGGASILGFRF